MPSFDVDVDAHEPFRLVALTLLPLFFRFLTSDVQDDDSSSVQVRIKWLQRSQKAEKMPPRRDRFFFFGGPTGKNFFNVEGVMMRWRFEKVSFSPLFPA